MSDFNVSQEKYEGPLETVIHLLRKRKLHVSDVNLAQIADEFSDYVQQSENTLSELSNFVRVMSVLLLIKAKALLPKESLGADDEETIAQFEADLARVELLKTITDNISAETGVFLLRRDRPKSVPTGFIADETISIDKIVLLAEALSQETKREETFAQVAVTKLANLKTTIDSIEKRFLSLQQAKLHDIIPESMSGTDKVVHFIALLELLKQNKITLDESDPDNKVLQYGHISTPNYGIK